MILHYLDLYVHVHFNQPNKANNRADQMSIDWVSSNEMLTYMRVRICSVVHYIVHDAAQ